MGRQCKIVLRDYHYPVDEEEAAENFLPEAKPTGLVEAVSCLAILVREALDHTCPDVTHYDSYDDSL